MSNPANPPQIDFEDYKKKVSNPQLVQQIEQAYKSLKITYPKDTLSGEVDKQEQEYKKQADDYVAVANTKIAEAEKLVCYCPRLNFCAWHFSHICVFTFSVQSSK